MGPYLTRRISFLKLVLESVLERPKSCDFHIPLESNSTYPPTLTFISSLILSFLPCLTLLTIVREVFFALAFYLNLLTYFTKKIYFYKILAFKSKSPEPDLEKLPRNRYLVNWEPDYLKTRKPKTRFLKP